MKKFISSMIAFVFMASLAMAWVEVDGQDPADDPCSAGSGYSLDAGMWYGPPFPTTITLNTYWKNENDEWELVETDVENDPVMWICSWFFPQYPGEYKFEVIYEFDDYETRHEYDFTTVSAT